MKRIKTSIIIPKDKIIVSGIDHTRVESGGMKGRNPKYENEGRQRDNHKRSGRTN